MDEWRNKGRKSSKKEQLLQVYKTLRCFMTEESCECVVKNNPRFIEASENDTDPEILEKIFLISHTINQVNPDDGSETNPIMVMK